MRTKDREAIKDIIHIQQKEFDTLKQQATCHDYEYAEGYVQACKDISSELAEHFVDWED